MTPTLRRCAGRCPPRGLALPVQISTGMQARPHAPPAWEAAAKPTTSRLSPNIKTRKKVAALFKSAPAPETNPSDNA